MTTRALMRRGIANQEWIYSPFGMVMVSRQGGIGLECHQGIDALNNLNESVLDQVSPMAVTSMTGGELFVKHKQN
ncbi:hypothetical protein [Mycobacterium sp.]|uniref:hypothetical protein n=1 Tax=Mycobacterium sp. TaxID=1785 RepID=UPI003A844EDF